MGFLWVFGILFVLLLILYAALSAWLRHLERRRLSERWAEGQGGTDRDAFIRSGMEAYDRSLRRRLLLGVIVLPLLGFALLLYLLNVA